MKKAIYIVEKNVRTGITNQFLYEDIQYYFSRKKAVNDYKSYFDELMKTLVTNNEKFGRYNYQCPWNMEEIKEEHSSFDFWNNSNTTYHAEFKTIYPIE